MSLLENFKTWRHYRARLADGRDLARELRRMLRWQRHRLNKDQAAELTGAVVEWSDAERSGKRDALVTARDRMELLLSGKFAYLRRPAWREQVEGIAVMVFLALFLRAFVVEAFQIPSGSMIPTLQVGDRIFVNKFIYGVRIPFTLVKFFARSPQRGDIIVFNKPGETDIDLIKRVVAIEGDEVEMKDSVVYVNGVAVARTPVDGQCRYWDFNEREKTWHEELCAAYHTTLDSREFTTLQSPLRGNYDTYEKHKIPPRSVFCLGDNRDNSADSRVWGTAPIEYIKGRAMFIWLSWGEPEGGLRTARLFLPVK